MNVREEHKIKTRELIQDGKSIEAIKYLRQELNLDLKTAMKLVEAIRDGMDTSAFKTPPSIGSRASSKITILVPGIFAVVGLLMLGITAYIYMNQQALIDQGNKVSAKVIASPGSPLFEYEFDGKTYQYQSSTSSNPPSYVMGEEVDMYVDANNPYHGIIDTFTDRWLVIVILGSMGGMFFGMGMLVMMVFRSRS